MKFALVTLLVMASAASSVALAQDGVGNGPPKLTSIIAASAPTAATSGVSIRKLFQPKSELGALRK